MNTKYSKIKCDDLEFCPKKIEFKKLTQTNVKIVHEDLNKLSDSIIKNRNKIGILVKKRYIETLEHIDKVFLKGLKKIVSFVALCDFYKSNAKTSCLYGYNRPEIVISENSFIDAKDIRHPNRENTDKYRLCNK